MIRIVTFSCVALGVALIAILFRASSNNTIFEQHYSSLFWLGLALTVGLLILIVVQVVGLAQKIRGQVFGAKLALRLMAVFALMAIIPGGLVYAISVQFLNRSVDSWFDVPVDKAFESALNLGRAALEANGNEVVRRVRDAALKAGDTNADAAELVKQIRQQYRFDEVSVLDENAAVTAWIGGDAASLTNKIRLIPDKPTRAEVRDAINKGPQKFTETLSERAIYFRVLILVPQLIEPVELPITAKAKTSVKAAPQVLQIMQSATRKIISDAQSVESGVRDYQRLQLLRDGLKRVFALTLTLAMVLTLFSAISLSFILSERLSAPLSALAESTRAIAKGDFTKLNPVKSRDEFGVLTQSFNTMTRQLSEASDVVARKQHELVTANAYLESILGNLTSGVITLDQDLEAKSINRIAADMLAIDPFRIKTLTFTRWPELYSSLTTMIEEIVIELGHERDKPWEKQFVISQGDNTAGAIQNALPTMMQSTVQMKATRTRTLLVRGTKLPQTTDADYILVFDDITGLIQAQRDAAWGEVARRLAHEIKNPLTPIQLSAERLQMKLADKLPEAEREMLSRATQTIVAQVGALKGMVDDFSLYSRASRMKPEMVDLNQLVNDVLALYLSMPARLEINLGNHLPLISADPALLRQVIHNLMQNAEDALSTNVMTEKQGVINVSTSIADDMLVFRVADNGSGIRDDVVARIFEPYVTTKAKGTGLGLPIVKKIIDEHRGTISVENITPHGAMVTIHLPVEMKRNSTVESAKTS
jgi:nitrogen fixation/metabolism regulation signal transduction histidine kinase